AWRNGDLFGTSTYLYIWSRTFGPLRYPIIPAYFRAKKHLAQLFAGKKKAIVIELSAEPWLLQPIVDTPLETQLNRMDVAKAQEGIQFVHDADFDTTYLWGAEWWYWLKLHGHPEFWQAMGEIFSVH